MKLLIGDGWQTYCNSTETWFIQTLQKCSIWTIPCKVIHLKVRLFHNIYFGRILIKNTYIFKLYKIPCWAKIVRRHRHKPQPPPLCCQLLPAQQSITRWCHWTLSHHPLLLRVESSWRWGWRWTSAATCCRYRENPWRPLSQPGDAVKTTERKMMGGCPYRCIQRHRRARSGVQLHVVWAQRNQHLWGINSQVDYSLSKKSGSNRSAKISTIVADLVLALTDVRDPLKLRAGPV